MPFDPFSFDTGLKEDYDGVIESASFQQNEQGNWQCVIVIHPEDNDDQVLKLGVGAKSGFASYDGHETITGPKADSKLNGNTAYAKFISACMRAGAEDELRERGELIFDTFGVHGPYHSSLWPGLKFHMDVVFDKTANQPDPENPGKWIPVKDESGEVVGRAVATPIKFLGVEGVGSGNGQVSVFDAADEMALTAAAIESPTFADFGKRVMELRDNEGKPMAQNRTIMSKLSQGWYESLKESPV